MKMWMALTLHLTLTLVPKAVTARDGGARILYPDLLDPNIAYAMYVINQEHPRPTESMAHQILEATVQVSSVVVYNYKLEVLHGNTTETCHVTIYSRPWLPPPNLFHRNDSVVCVPHETGIDGPSRQQACGEGSMTDTSPSTSYPALRLKDDEKSALLYFVEQHNAWRSVKWRFIPYDVTVRRERADLPYHTKFLFSLRMVASQCHKPEPSHLGKLSLEDCPPERDSDLRYDYPKCVAEVLWQPYTEKETYKYMGYNCPRS